MSVTVSPGDTLISSLTEALEEPIGSAIKRSGVAGLTRFRGSANVVTVFPGARPSRWRCELLAT